MHKSLIIDLLSQFDKSKQIAKSRLLVEIRIRRHINYTPKPVETSPKEIDDFAKIGYWIIFYGQ